MTCPAPVTGNAFLSGVLTHLDCQAQTLGSTGYQLLAAPNSPVSIALGALLTVFVAFFGIRMLLGHVPDLRDGVIAIVKIGVVLLLATSWPAVRVLAYDVVLHGPAEIVASVGQSSLPGAGGGLTARLQAVDDAIVALGARGSGQNDVGAAQPLGIRTNPVADDFAFGGGRIAFLGSIIGSLAAIRLGGGLLLALAPLFAGLLLFEVTRGAFLGWAKALFATFLGAVAITVVLGVELALLEPWLTDALAQRAANIATLSAPVELLVVTLGFAIALFTVAGLLARAAFHQVLSVATFVRSEVAGQVSQRDSQSSTDRETIVQSPDHERAVAVADAIAASQRREASSTTTQSRRVTLSPAERTRDAEPATVPLGQTWRRQRPRLSQGARRRDART